MPATKRATIYFDPLVYEALRERAAEARDFDLRLRDARSRDALDEDVADQRFRRAAQRADDRFDDFVADMKRRGRL